MWDVTAQDPRLLVYLKAYRNTVPVPRHWSQKRKFLQASDSARFCLKRGDCGGRPWRLSPRTPLLFTALLRRGGVKVTCGAAVEAARESLRRAVLSRALLRLWPSAQGKRGIEKPPFELPDFIAATGIGKASWVNPSLSVDAFPPPFTKTTFPAFPSQRS